MNQNKLQVSGQFLYSFPVVAKHLSFTKAAEDLCITQSAVSHRIRCLEQELGFPLFHRLTRKIILTEEGKTLYGALDASLKQIHETIRNIQEAELQGDLVIACAPSIAGCWLLPRSACRSEVRWPQSSRYLEPALLFQRILCCS